MLFSCDTDLLPALEAVDEMHACRIEVACWSPARPLRFAGTPFPWCHYLREDAWERAAEDWKGRI